MEFNKPIVTLEQARCFFKGMGCSGFHMSREYPDRYNEYRQLNIGRETENLWRQEVIDKLYDTLMQKGGDELTLGSYLEYVEDSGTCDNIIKAFNVVNKYYKSLSPLGMIVIVEDLYGSRAPYPRGCIFIAHKLGLFEVENQFKNLSMKMVSIAGTIDSSLKERGEHAIAPRVYDQDIINTLKKWNILNELNEIE